MTPDTKKNGPIGPWRELQRHPLSAEYEDLAGERWDNLVADIKKNGFDRRKPIYLLDNMVLEGWQRQRAGVATGVKPVYAPMPQGIEPEAFVARENDFRRHESESQRERRIEARKKRVAEARANGTSFRAIAAEEGISQTQAKRDAEDSGVTHVTPDIANSKVQEAESDEKVTGVDGKTYPKKRPKVLCTSCTCRLAKGAPLIENCDECAKVRSAPRPAEEKRPKAGKPKFDEKKFDKAYGALVRVVDERGNAMGKGQHHQRCQDILGDFIVAYKLWKKETA